MRDKAKKPGDIVYEIELLEVLRSAGILMASVGIDIISTDKMYGEEWQMETAAALSGSSELLAHIFKRYSNVLTGIEIAVPDHIIGVVTANPLRGNSMAKPSYDEEGDDIFGGSEFPF